MKKMTIAAAFAAFLMLAGGCSKKEEVFNEPYGQGKSALGIVINTTQAPVPESGNPGVEVSIKATGLVPYKDKLILRINGEQAVVKEVTETGIKAVVPDNASSGVISVSVDDKVVFGPIFKVTGYLSVDPTFRATNGANGAVYQRLVTDDGKIMLVGSFNNYDNRAAIKPINRIVRTFQDGSYDASLRSGKGANGLLTRIIALPGKFVVAGSFNGYDQRTENISNITMLNTNGSIDTMGVKTFRRPTQTDTIKYFPKFNGGTDGGISQMYEQNGKVLITGSFRYYVSRRYDRPNKYETRDTVILDSTEIRQIARLNADGTLDKSYRFNTATNSGLPGGNGNIQSYMHKEGALAGKLLVYGAFTKFDNTTAGYITRLNPDGTVDPTFNPGGTGADFKINNASYNALTKRYIITGSFRSYNGKSSEYIAMLNEDGTLDPTFVPKKVEGSLADSKQLNNGLIVVTGGFKTYGGVIRNGFMILEKTGALAVGYNSTGIFNGWLGDVIDTQTEDGKPAILLIGSFDRFDNEPVNNILRLVINKEKP
ncbi:DUF5008 domain-containing protein [Pedobacter sp. HMWF019]|uniref:DUF5008 domain-containing protein n=1 Tax=Pedobacter sp. HMWF019 TaxID=2056856 RepID=UPI001E595E59|nr:DUF5008 domain-containing protein [Pedobacter sp. HMWF019]